ncbi:ABC-ATPase domain-containing protein, partial [Streptomyces nanshensis]
PPRPETRSPHEDRPPRAHGGPPRDGLDEQLARLEGASYGRYKSLVGTSWKLPGAEATGATLRLVRGQADPFAP